ncbi:MULTISPECIES: hypothetical protein [Streptomyces]|uniref:Uncharacterized protein n=1 Tax=Streptomyces parvus TaxID=66428 RepID=A0A5D4JQI1_9ACTN|nr:hypothetical protein [Streptomyces parvus]TYR66535.1 hypothetical protein FY004_00185 [Streptomyces parvus]GGW04648.1 hypothetical protein GCM10010264_22040 [Streptomyces globisporus]
MLYGLFTYICLRVIGEGLSIYVKQADEHAERFPYYSDAKALSVWLVGDVGAGAIALLLLAYPLWSLLASVARMCGAGGYTFERVTVWTHLIGQCADIVRCSSGSRDAHLRALSLRLPVMRVRGARMSRGSVPFLSRRNGPLKSHAAQVVGALRAAEAELDKDPQKAAHDLARMALTISERYATGRLGALLDERDLGEPHRMGDAVRLSLTVVLVAAIAVAAARQGMPEPAAIAAAVVVVAIIYRNAAAGGVAGVGLIVLELLLGSFFPGK